MRRFEIANKIEDGKVIGEWEVTSLPVYATEKAAGADFFAAEDVVIKSLLGGVFKALFKDSYRQVTGGVKDLLSHTSLKVDIKVEDQEEAKKVAQPTLVHTGIKACMEEDEVLHLYNRSSNPKKLGLVLANSVGVVDADYYNNPDNDGEIMFAFYNFFPFDITIHKGDKIGQGEFVKFLRPDNAIIGGKRTGGFGSTDKK